MTIYFLCLCLFLTAVNLAALVVTRSDMELEVKVLRNSFERLEADTRICLPTGYRVYSSFIGDSPEYKRVPIRDVVSALFDNSNIEPVWHEDQKSKFTFEKKGSKK